ncbi:hypothetical protein SUDANB176_07870 (plasmid) [Streptomyces sp. enrichment culture]|uniref:hypothetical protein n=1 Tax=Streptomyces sp. enrichment culture TaxID=1795815 RepID=UPI003F550904
MPSLWRFVPGSGWVLQPVPASPGCVVAPGAAQRFGFGRALSWVRKIVITAVVVLTTATLAWMWNDGHEVEIASEVLVGVLFLAVAAVYADIKRFFRPGGEVAWLCR